MSTVEHVGKDCCGCGACAAVCPKNCIRMTPGPEGFLYPSVDAEACVQCSRCERVCPVLHMGEDKTEDLREAWAAVQKDPQILRESSSGGLFTALAEEVLGEGGCVFGVAFTEDFRRVRHIMAERSEQLAPLRGAKYVQSETGNCYALVREQLEKGRSVLFTGTPCQIAGLKRFLGREYERLYLVDIICHGVPSAAVWQRYLDQLSGKYKEMPSSANFRDKTDGWSWYGLEIRFTDGKRFFQHMPDNPYMKMFLRNVCLRESCYHCAVKQAGAAADLTIGDFWGVEHVLPELERRMGVSLALIHTEKGRRLFEKAGQKLERRQVDYEPAVADNSVLDHSVSRPAARDVFFRDLETLSWGKLRAKYGADSMAVTIRRKLAQSVIGRMYRAARRRFAAAR